ncbi:MAG: hypothetical protein LQ342_004165 [Letrouitia transgressa]|nr:MAG: hypothetical protein LQ342_004165 [Letrouitia transgressa]
MLLKCTEKIERYEKRGKLGKTAWCVFGNEIQDAEIKMAEWIGGLMNWAVVVDADQRLLVNVPRDSLLFNPDEQHDYGLRQANSTDHGGIGTTGQNNLPEHTSDDKKPSNSLSLGPPDLQFIKDDMTDVSAGTNLVPTAWSSIAGYQASWDLLRPIIEPGQLIGEGAFGEVYQVAIQYHHHNYSANTQRKHQYALKRFRSSTFEDFKNEAAVLQELNRRPHDHITPLINAWEENGTGHLLFPLAQGDLRSFLMNVLPTPGKIIEQWLLTQMTGVVSATSYIHESGYHADLKPENILIFHNEKEGCGRWSVSDFGVSQYKSDTKWTKNLPAAPSPSGNGQAKTDMSLHRGTEIYRAPPSRRPNHVTNASADMWALGCIFLEVLAWYFQPTGYTIRGFHHSRVQTIRENGDTAVEDLTSAKFWALDGRERPIIHPSVGEWLNDIKDLAKSSEWLLDVPYHVEKLLSIEAEARFTASDLETILQHGLALKKAALGDSGAPYAILNGRPLPKANFLLDLMGGSLKCTYVQQAETVQTQKGSASSILPCIKSPGQLERTARMPSLRKKGKWTQNQVRNQYLQP